MSDVQRRLYRGRITHAQLDAIRDLNKRNKTSPPAMLFRNSDVVDIVEDNDPEADLITGQWFGMVVGVMPDGSCHS